MDPYVISVGNVKGGVGKSTTAVQLALHAAAIGQRTLLIDADPGRSALSWSARATGWPALVKVIAYRDADLPRRIAGLARGFDLVILDLPHDPEGGAQAGLMLTAGMAAADLFLVPTSPSGADLDRLSDIDAAVRREQARRVVARQDELVWKVFLNRVDLRRRAWAAEAAEDMGGFGLPLLAPTTWVPDRARVEDAFGTPAVLLEFSALAGTVLAYAATPGEAVA